MIASVRGEIIAVEEDALVVSVNGDLLTDFGAGLPARHHRNVTA